MKVKIYLSLNEYAKDGYTLVSSLPHEGWMGESSDYKFVGETDININDNISWLASKGLEFAEKMEEAAREELAHKLSAVADYKAKFLSLTHQVSEGAN